MSKADTVESLRRPSKAHPGLTARADMWWVEPAIVATVFTVFGIYATWRAFSNADYQYEHYLSPFYSPKIILDWWKFSPAILILWVPLGFRATCYYYRKAYYRAYFMDPPACTVGHLGGESYCGETSFPFILQNLHRYFFYAAAIVLAFLWYDVFDAVYYNESLHLSGVSIVMLINVCLLSGYSLGCHACRHLVGGRSNCFSKDQGQFKLWKLVTKFNEHHMAWAWSSLVSVAVTDLYIMLVIKHVLPELRIF